MPSMPTIPNHHHTVQRESPNSTPISFESSPVTSSQDKPSNTAGDSLMNLLSTMMPLPDHAGVASFSALPPPGPLYYWPQDIDKRLSHVIREDPFSDATDEERSKEEEDPELDQDLEPIPIHPEFSHSSNELERIPAPSAIAAALSIVNGSLDRFPALPQHNESILLPNKKQDGSKRPLTVVLPDPSSSDTTTRPNKRSCTRRVSNDGNRSPRFRNYQEKQWTELYEQLLEFKHANGHCLVPHTFPENPTLSRWVKRQRYQYKLKAENMLSTMTDARIKTLESIGFVWDSHAVAWEEHRLELVKFHSTFGHCDVPSSYENNPSLATWVKRQRRQKKLFSSGQKSTMTKERFTLLEEMGFSWEMKTNNKQWRFRSNQ